MSENRCAVLGDAKVSTYVAHFADLLSVVMLDEDGCFPDFVCRDLVYSPDVGSVVHSSDLLKGVHGTVDAVVCHSLGESFEFVDGEFVVVAVV